MGNITSDKYKKERLESNTMSVDACFDLENLARFESIEHEIMCIVSRILNVDLTDEEGALVKDLFHYGLESLTSMQLLSQLRSSFDIDVPMRILWANSNVLFLSTYIGERLNK